MSISIKNLTKRYAEQIAVNALQLELHKGEIVGFLGPNGAGKSTTMKMITGYLQPDEGEISIDGINVLENPLEAKKKIGYLPESNALYYDMYVKEYLFFIADLHELADKKKAVDTAIEKVGLTPESGKKIGQLSKGYKQRVGLAAALIHDPEILILDEPTTGLDPNQILEIRAVIRELGKNKTILFSSHILQEVEALCTRVIVINKGVLVADSSLGQLLNSRTNRQLAVRFKKDFSMEIFADLGSIKSSGRNGFTLKTEKPDEVKKKILERSLSHGLDIVSLTEEEGSNLEGIFRDLTK